MVGDGHQPGWVRRVVEDLGQCGVAARLLVHGPTRNKGNSQRTFAQRVAKGEWIAFMDDDDIFTEEAFIKIRKAIRDPQGEVLIFKVVAPWREVVWAERSIEQGNCLTIQNVVRNHDLPPWPLRQGGNIPWLHEMALRGLEWRPEIIAICNPYEEDKWFK